MQDLLSINNTQIDGISLWHKENESKNLLQGNQIENIYLHQ